MPKTDQHRELQPVIDEILGRRPTIGCAIGVISGGELVHFHGHGVADIADGAPITADTVFRVASITKTFTAIAALQLWEQGRVDLDAPASEYLRSYRLVPRDNRFRPVTLRHLMTHTAGIREVPHASGLLRPVFGEAVRPGRRVPPLAEAYRDGLLIDWEPGTRWRYTDHGPATVGQIVEDVSGQPFADYLRDHVFGPLGMTASGLSTAAPTGPRAATGYEIGARGIKRVPAYGMATGGASCGYSSATDMARYLAALLGGGRNAYGAVLAPGTLATMYEQHFSPDPRIAGMGLGFWLGETGGHRFAEHGGVLPGFHSQIFVAPDDGVGVMAFTNGSKDAMFWLPGAMAGLLETVLGVHGSVVRTDVPQRPQVWDQLCGWYQLPGPLTDARARLAMGAGMEVLVRGGRLVVRMISPIPVLYRGFELHPDDEKDPYAFRIDMSELGIGTGRILFGKEPGSCAESPATAVHFDLSPMTAYRRPTTSDPRRWLQAAGVTAAGALGVGLVRALVRG